MLSKTSVLKTLLFACTLVFPVVAAARGLGEIPPGGFKSPEGDKRFTAEAGAKPLNNLVFELLNIQSPGLVDHIFRNPREGWIHIRVLKPRAGGGKPPVAILDDKEIALKPVGDHHEAMRYACEGAHTVGVRPGAEPVGRLEVRAVGELFYAAYGDNPHIAELGNYTWEFLKQHCLDHYNSVIGSNKLAADGKPAQEAEIREWTAQGKRWFTLHPVPDDVRTTRPSKSADDAYDYWTNTLGMQHPLMSGIWADEFGPNQARFFPFWVEGLRRIHADPRFKDRKFHAYCPNRFWPLEDGYKVMYPFVQTLGDCGYRLGPEWYQVEGRSRPGRTIARTEDLIDELSPEWERTSRESFEKASPGAAANRVVVMSLLSEPGWENGDLYPGCDYNVFLDCQFQFIATDPAFFAIRGIQGYLSSYCGEEQLRLFARLIRHYAIEGRTDRMLKDPYVLAHIENPDFEKGTKGWTLAPAVDGNDQASIAVKTATGFGVLQGKYHGPAGLGDVALWTRRSAAKPNVISQPVRGLVPGRLYSLRFVTGDYKELTAAKSADRRHAVSVKLGDTEPLADKCFQAVVKAGYWYPHGAYNARNPYHLNYHQRVFRAAKSTSKLTLSDWPADDSAAGPEGEELIWNFVQLQPYVE